MTAEEAFAKFKSNPEQDTWHHLDFMLDAAKGNILEIGVNEGASTSAFLSGVHKNGGHVYSIDINPACGKVFDDPQWSFTAGNSREISGFAYPALDTLFVDGDHTYEGALSDLMSFGPSVRSGGLILVHDVLKPDKPKPWGDFPGVSQAFLRFLSVTGWSATVRPHSWGLGIVVAP